MTNLEKFLNAVKDAYHDFQAKHPEKLSGGDVSGYLKYLESNLKAGKINSGSLFMFTACKTLGIKCTEEAIRAYLGDL